MLVAMGAVTSLFVRKMVAAAGPEVDSAHLLRSVGLDPEASADPKAMVADTAYYGLLEQIAEQTDVTRLPLRGGASMRCDDYGALGLAWKAAPDLLGSYRRVERFARIWTDVVEYELRRAEGGMWFFLHRSGARRLGLRLSNEATMASAVAISREVSPVPFTPLEVHFRHPAPRKTAHHIDYFGCDVVFESDRDALLIADDALAQRNRLGDEAITQFLLGHLVQELAELEEDRSLTDRTKTIIARALSEGLPKMDEVARRLGMSVRSLHRRLAEHGMSFQSLTEDTRRELAIGLLSEEDYSIAEIAFLTGFSEQSAFTRAFKRWQGATPASFRRGQKRR
ncbi:MAG: AraC family transcriptional regulator [Pseudomonadota bacterium]